MNKKIEQGIAVVLVIIVFGGIALQAVSVDGTKTLSTAENGDILNTAVSSKVLDTASKIVNTDTKEAEAFYKNLDALGDKAKAEGE